MRGLTAFTRVRAAATGALLCLHACAPAADADPAGTGTGRATVTDSSGVRIVSHPDLTASPALRWSIVDPPALVLGGAGDGDAPRLTASIDIAPDGAIVVADRASATIRTWDRTGALVSTIGGGRGEPVRFETLWRAKVAADGRIHALDTGEGRITVLEPDGSVVSTAPLPEALSRTPAGASPQPGNLELLGALPRGETVVTGRPYADSAAEGWMWAETVVLAVAGDGSTRTIMTMPQMELVGIAASPVPVRPHFRAVTEAAVAGDRIAFSTGRDYRVEYHDASGARAMSVRAALEPVAATREHLDAYRTWLFEQLGDAPEETLDAYRQAFAATPASPALPAIRHIIADAEGCVWVERHPDPRTWVAAADTVPHRWDVFGIEGHRVGWIEIPAGLRVRAADRDRVIVTAESGPVRIQVHDLARTASCRAGPVDGRAGG